MVFQARPSRRRRLPRCPRGAVDGCARQALLSYFISATPSGSIIFNAACGPMMIIASVDARWRLAAAAGKV